MEELSYLSPALPDDYSGRFIAAGVILVLVAALCGCFTAAIPVQFFMLQRLATMPPVTVHTAGGTTQFSPHPIPTMPLSQAVVGTAIYLALAIAAGWLGVAAFLKRRYVRPLVLIFGTHGVILGVFTVLMTGAMMPLILEQARLNAQVPVAMTVIGLVVGIGMMALFMIGIPVTLLILMKPDAVRVTAEHYDLRRRWTDGVPLKLLGLVVTLAVLAGFELFALARPGIPLVTTLLTGFPAAGLVLLHAALMAMAAVLIYRRRLVGWHLAFWGMVLPLTVFAISSVTLPAGAYLQLMADQPNAVELYERHATLMRGLGVGMTLLFLVSYVVYLLRMRRLIAPPIAQTPSD